MSRDFFDPTPEEQNVVLVDTAKLRKAERLIESCEHCNPDAVKRLELFNAAKEIAEAEREKNRRSAALSDMVHTISPTVTENPPNFSSQEIEGKTQQIN